jgi:hypothetical protein
MTETDDKHYKIAGIGRDMIAIQLDLASKQPMEALNDTWVLGYCFGFASAVRSFHVCAGRMLPSLQQNEIGTSKLDPFRCSIPSPWSPL